MNILIVGLGLIGGSYAINLTKNGYNVYGYDIDNDTISYALNSGWIKEGSTNVDDYIELADLIVICLYPQLILNFLKENKNKFKKGQIITDVCGVKSSFIYEAALLVGDAIYLSHHPMAGREKKGITFASGDIFKGANFLITPTSSCDEEIKILSDLAKTMGFGKISIISPEYHDNIIGFTSQLTHAIAVSLVNSDSDENTKNFIGDSYRDLTRIAMINEGLWSELFLENKDMLLSHIEKFEKELDTLKDSLYNNDKEKLNELFVKSTKTRKGMEK